VVSAVIATSFLGGSPGVAHAYLLDLSDATVAAPHTLELEVQPSGYIASVASDELSHQAVPSLNAVLGLAPRFDLTVTTRARLDPSTQANSLYETALAVRLLIADGGYASGEGSDPSLALQWGLGLPEVGGASGLAPSVAVLLSLMIGDVSAHGHVELILTREREREVFASVVLQAPSSWAVQPVVEISTTVPEEGATVSGLLGAIVPLEEDLAIEAGVRVAGWQALEEVEVRLALAWALGWQPASRQR